MGIIEVWTIVAIVLHFCGVGIFASWPVIASPFTWSCCTLEIWVLILYIATFLILFCSALIGRKK